MYDMYVSPYTNKITNTNSEQPQDTVPRHSTYSTLSNDCVGNP